MNKKKGIYLVTNSRNIKKSSGAYKHILVGMDELSKFFDMKLIDTTQEDCFFSESDNKVFHKSSQSEKPSSLRGTLIDIKSFIKNHKPINRLYKRIKTEQPDFIYERSEYLSYAGLLIAKVLKIPDFYEVNGIAHEDIKVYYNSLINPLYKAFELYSYKKSTFTFCVGGIGFQLPKHFQNWMPIQNGIYIDDSSSVKEKVSEKKGKIDIVFLANLMPHHQLELLIDALKQDQELSSHIHLNLIGDNFQTILNKIPPSVSHTYHGVLYNDKLNTLLSKMDYGIIPHARDYDSHVKLFHYASLKLPIVIPTSKNFMTLFNEQNVDFFNNSDLNSLSSTLKTIIYRDDSIKIQKADNLYTLVMNNYTWEKIYSNVSFQIERYL